MSVPRSLLVPLAAPPLAAAVLAVLAGAAGAAQEPDDAGVTWEPYTARAYDGTALEGRLGRIAVPARHARPDGPTLELAFAVFPSTAEEPGPPIFYLVGGPGASGVEWGPYVATDPRIDLLRFGDLVAIDQRGTGLSDPGFDDGPAFAWEVPPERAMTRDDMAAAYGEALGRAAAHWRDRGVDLGAFDTAESAEDVEAVRRALGAERIVTYGESYGTHLSLAYLRRHAERVARSVLVRLEGPDDTFKLPGLVQRQLERLQASVAAEDGAPDLLGTLRALLARLEAEPVRVPLPGGGGELAIGPFDLRLLVAQVMADSRAIAGLPAALAHLEDGDWAPMAPMFLRNRRGEVGSVMGVLMDCASGASRARAERIREEAGAAQNLLGDALSAPLFPEVCAACGDVRLDDAFRAPFACDVPLLVVTGALDPRTPPENVRALAEGFSRAVEVTVRNALHDSRELEVEEYRALLRAFLSGERVEDATIDLPPLRFGR